MSHAAPTRAPEGLFIDRLQRAAERDPAAALLDGLSHAEAWIQSGAVASWLIAQGFGPGTRSVAVTSAGPADRVAFLLGALRAGALITVGDDKDAMLVLDRDGLVLNGRRDIAFAALAHCSIDASVAERRLHIAADTPALMEGGRLLRHGEVADIGQLAAGA